MTLQGNELVELRDILDTGYPAPITFYGTTGEIAALSFGGGVIPVLIFPDTAAAISGLTVYSFYANSLPVTFNLPAVPANNQIVSATDAGNTASTGAITVNGNGNNINANGIVGGSYVIGSSGSSITLAWDTIQWSQIA